MVSQNGALEGLYRTNDRGFITLVRSKILTWIRIKMKIWIRIRIKVVQISNSTTLVITNTLTHRCHNFLLLVIDMSSSFSNINFLLATVLMIKS
jgi:hypothetical protein